MNAQTLRETFPNPIRVGSDGHVRLVDVMGDDEAVVQAARVSYGKGTKTVREDAALIDYLYSNGHTSPFEMAEIKLSIRVPMDVWRQWVRQRTASLNEHSTRYSEAIDAAATTAPHQWRMQSTNNKQGSAGFLDEDIGGKLTEVERDLHAMSRAVYKQRLDMGVAREQARKDLPLSNYTEAFWKIDLHNLLRFLSQRLHPHAQQEIREFAEAIARIVKVWVPQVWAAFEEHTLGGMRLSRSAIAAINAGELPDTMPKREAAALRKAFPNVFAGCTPPVAGDVYVGSRAVAWVVSANGDGTCTAEVWDRAPVLGHHDTMLVSPWSWTRIACNVTTADAAVAAWEAYNARA